MSDLSIFRVYDIRGIYNKTLNEEIMKKIGYSFGLYVDSDIVVARDCRLSGPSLSKAFISGFLEAGNNIDFIGEVPLAVAVFYAIKHKKYLAYITASHLATEWNGIKFFMPDGIGFVESENNEIKLRFEKYEQPKIEKQGQINEIESKKPIEQYVNFVTFKMQPKKHLKIVIDCGNGTAGYVVPDLFRKAGHKVVVTFGKPDGRIPNRNPDPTADKLKKLKESILKHEADMGIAFDIDADRLVILDEKARVLNQEQLSYIILKDLLQKQKGPVVVNVECTNLLKKIANEFGCDVIRVPVGDTFLMQAVHEHKAVFGTERSGHCTIPFITPFDDAIAISYYISCILEEPLSKQVKEMPKVFFERVNFKCEDDKKFKAMDKLKNTLQKKYENISTTDGIRVDISNNWILIRASNTEPTIRLTIEAESDEELKKLKNKFKNIIDKEIKKQ